MPLEILWSAGFLPEVRDQTGPRALVVEVGWPECLLERSLLQPDPWEEAYKGDDDQNRRADQAPKSQPEASVGEEVARRMLGGGSSDRVRC